MARKRVSTYWNSRYVSAITHAIVLAVWERGFGCVINGKGIMICIAMGYPDEAFVANDVKSRRKDNASLSSKLRSLGSW